MVRVTVLTLTLAVMLLICLVAYQGHVIDQQSRAINLLMSPPDLPCPQPPSALTVTVHSLPTAPATHSLTRHTLVVSSATSAPK